MKHLQLVSIALCTYNGDKFLRQQLDTLVHQSYPYIEIIAVDDCSHDNTYAILSEYASEFKQLRVYRNKENVGFVSNFERALSYCKGDFIAFCDQDDIWDLKKIEIQVNAIGNNILLYHDSEFIDDENKPLNRKMSDLFNFYRGSEPKAFLFFNCISGHTMLIKRELLKEVKPFKGGFFHDWWIAYVAANIGVIDYLPYCLVKYRQHTDSDTDLLKRKDVKKDKYRYLSKKQIFDQRSNWLQHCAAFPKNKTPHFVKTLSYLYKEWPNSYLSIQLTMLMARYMDILYFIQKKSVYKKKREISKFLWGYKARNFWYTYIKPDNEKAFFLNQEYTK